MHSGSVTERSDPQIVVRELAPDEIVTREVPPQEIVVKEILRQEVVKEIAPPEVVKKKAGVRKASYQPPPRVQDASLQVPDLDLFLDRLMHAESGGRDWVANPRSSAVGPFQFIRSTFIDVARRHFPREVSELSDEQVLELRTHRNFARAAAAAFTTENAAQLKAQGAEPSLPNLRLAFLLGASGAARVLQAQPQQRLSEVLGPSVLRANPFMVGMTAIGLIAKAGRDVLGRSNVGDVAPRRNVVVRPSARLRPDARPRPGGSTVAVKNPVPSISIKVSCNEKLAVCQRWIALQIQKQLRQQKVRDAHSTGSKSRKLNASS